MQQLRPVEISKVTARRFILGRQGLWPGRRWAGLEGSAQALHNMQALQLDPLNVVARSQDIALYGRVLDYRPEYLDQVAYQQRQFFDYGASLFIYPMHELPYWHAHMQRWQDVPRWAGFAAENPQLLEQVRAELRARGPLGNRDFDGSQRVNSYRGRKDTALALFYLWLTGELMIHHRERFERVYSFRDEIAPPAHNHAASQAETEAYFARKTCAFLGLVRAVEWKNSFADYIHQKVSLETARQRLEQLQEEHVIAPVQVAGDKELRYALHSDLEDLHTLEAGGIPPAWRPLGPTTQDEAVLLAPLEIASARGRARWLFDFDYVWEVYKPAAQRRWGYYTLPVLYGDRLVARLDPRLERKSMTLQILGFWLEADAPASDPAFAAALGRALGRGLARFARFVKAQQVDMQAIQPAELQAGVQAAFDRDFSS
ncbi:MAG: crosslink repair DNA glycosylase YcaQ family protein [Chloroflexota bacterium]